MNKLKQLRSDLRSGLWLLPWLIVADYVLVVAALIETHANGSDRWLDKWPRLFGPGATGARGVLAMKEVLAPAIMYPKTP